LIYVQIQAEDKDSGRNGEIEYSFAPGTYSRVTQLFYLQPDTGNLQLKTTLKDCGNYNFYFSNLLM